MTQPSAVPERQLAMRLRELRSVAGGGQKVTQRQISQALSVSVPLVSSWESGRSDAVPSPDRIEEYARFFATRRSVTSVPARLVELDRLTVDERASRDRLLEELLAIRNEAAGQSAQPVPRSFFHFPDGQPVRIVSSTLPHYEIGSQYGNKWHPNYIAAIRNGDMDATVELYGHIRALNPDSDVAWVHADQITPKVFASHVVLLGAGSVGGSVETTSALEFYTKRLDLPVTATLPGGNPEYDWVWRVTTDEDGAPEYKGPKSLDFPAVFILDESSGERVLRGGPRTLALWPESPGTRPPDDAPATIVRAGEPLLEYDVALLARQPNPLQLSTTVTVCAGLFSRGTYGMVRALTDPQRVGPNEAYLRALQTPDDFWLLTYVPMFAGVDGVETVAPDLNRPMNVLIGSEQLSGMV